MATIKLDIGRLQGPPGSERRLSRHRELIQTGLVVRSMINPRDVTGIVRKVSKRGYGAVDVEWKNSHNGKTGISINNPLYEWEMIVEYDINGE